MRRNLSPADLGDLLEQPLLAILASNFADGRTLLSPVWHEWDGEAFVVTTAAGDVKTRQLEADQRASIVVAEQTPPYRSIEVRGQAVLDCPDDVVEISRRIAIRYLGEAGGNEFVAGFEPAQLCRVRIVPERLRAWDYADEMA